MKRVIAIEPKKFLLKDVLSGDCGPPCESLSFTKDNNVEFGREIAAPVTDIIMHRDICESHTECEWKGDTKGTKLEDRESTTFDFYISVMLGVFE